MSIVDEQFIEAIILEDITRRWPEIRSALEIDPETGRATKAMVVKFNYRSTPIKVDIVPVESTAMGAVEGVGDVMDVCQALMAVAYIRHPQRKGAFTVSKAYPVAAMEKIYVMEKEDAMSTESDYESESDDESDYELDLSDMF
jgi:hypothetical protein